MDQVLMGCGLFTVLFGAAMAVAEALPPPPDDLAGPIFAAVTGTCAVLAGLLLRGIG